MGDLCGPRPHPRVADRHQLPELPRAQPGERGYQDGSDAVITLATARSSHLDHAAGPFASGWTHLNRLDGFGVRTSPPVTFFVAPQWGLRPSGPA